MFIVHPYVRFNCTSEGHVHDGSCAAIGSVLTSHTMTPTPLQTRWGSFELVLAAKLLLREALLEPTNAYFVMVSESDVPLYPPAVVYRQILSEGRSRIDACGQEV